jgi:hypothetical protein
MSLTAGNWGKAAGRGKSKGPPEEEDRRKRLFFDTTEAGILLKTKDRLGKLAG